MCVCVCARAETLTFRHTVLMNKFYITMKKVVNAKLLRLLKNRGDCYTLTCTICRMHRFASLGLRWCS